MTAGLGIKAGLLLAAVTVKLCPELGSPLVMPKSAIDCGPEFSMTVVLLMGVSVGAWLTAMTLTVKVALEWQGRGCRSR